MPVILSSLLLCQLPEKLLKKILTGMADSNYSFAQKTEVFMSTSSLTSVASGVTASVNLLLDLHMAHDAYTALSESQQQNDGSTCETLSLASSLALAGFSITDITMKLSGAKTESLKTLKESELLPRILNAPLQFTMQAKRMEREGESLKGTIKLIEKGLIAPISDVCRVACQVTEQVENNFLKELAKNSKAQRPIYETRGYGEDTEVVIVGYRPIDPKECEAAITKSRTQMLAATTVRAITQTSMTSKVVCDVGQPTVEALVAFLRRPNVANNGHALLDADNALNFDLMNLDAIPAPLHNDYVFSQYICAINQRPIRDVVRDPTNHITLYERSAITTWLQNHTTSPTTRVNMTVAQLEEVPVIQAAIDQRLALYRANLQQFLADEVQRRPEGMQVAVQAPVVAQVQAEQAVQVVVPPIQAQAEQVVQVPVVAQAQAEQAVQVQAAQAPVALVQAQVIPS